MANWRDELKQAVKSKAEREAEEEARRKKRVEEAMAVAQEALQGAFTALGFAKEALEEKKQPVSLEGGDDQKTLKLGEFSLTAELDRDSAILRITFGNSKPREFDFAKDRHIAAADVEEYTGRRSVELVRAAQKASPW